MEPTRFRQCIPREDRLKTSVQNNGLHKRQLYKTQSQALTIVSASQPSLPCGLLVGRNRVCRLQRGTASHIDGHAEGLFHLRARGAEPDQCLCLEADAAIAVRRNSDRERDQFLGSFLSSAPPRPAACARAETVFTVSATAASARVRQVNAGLTIPIELDFASTSLFLPLR